MNALDKVKDMENALRNAGFEVLVKEEDDMYFVSASNSNKTNVFSNSKHFMMMASKSYGSNKWHKRLTVSKWGLFSKDTEKKNLSYAEMWREINFAIRFDKVGA